MNDLISRQAAIDAAIEAADDWDGGCSKERERFIRDALEELPSAQPEPHWIPVSERLPNSTEKVLVSAWNPVFDVPIHTEIDRHAIGEEWFLSGKWVTAWMPLPEPYEEEKRNA